jgi:hypothetical protein
MADPLFECKICQRFFWTKKAFTYHNWYEHRNIKYSCSFCDKDFKTKSNLERHLKVHKNAEKGEEEEEEEEGEIEVFARKRKGEKIDSDVVPPSKKIKQEVEEKPKKRIQSNEDKTSKGGTKKEVSPPPSSTTAIKWPEVEKYYEIKIMGDEASAVTRIREVNFIVTFNQNFRDLALLPALEAINNILDNVMKKIIIRTKAKPHDLIKWTLECDSLDYPINVELLPVSQSSTVILFDAIERVVQSHEEFLFDESVRMKYILVPMVKVKKYGGRDTFSGRREWNVHK